jgi:hypothetical protein
MRKINGLFRVPSQQAFDLKGTINHVFIRALKTVLLGALVSCGVHLKRIQSSHNLKPDSVGPPSRNIVGADIRRVKRPEDASGRKSWSVFAYIYIKNAVRSIKLLLQEEGCGLKSTAKSHCFSNSS